MPSDEHPTVENAYDRLSRTYETHEEDPYCADFEIPDVPVCPGVELRTGFRQSQLTAVAAVSRFR